MPQYCFSMMDDHSWTCRASAPGRPPCGCGHLRLSGPWGAGRCLRFQLRSANGAVQHPAAGRRRPRNRQAVFTTNDFEDRVIAQWGATYPVFYAYDPIGNRTYAEHSSLISPNAWRLNLVLAISRQFLWHPYSAFSASRRLCVRNRVGCHWPTNVHN